MSEEVGKVERKATPSGEVAKAKSQKLKDNAHWVALLGGLLPAVTAGVISVVAAVKGEPEANRAYEILAPQLNAQRSRLIEAEKSLAKLEGRSQGWRVGKISAQLDALREENQKLKDQLAARPTSVKKGSAASKPTVADGGTKCRKGYVLAEGKCRRVNRAVAKKVADDERRAAEIARKLNEKHRWLQQEKQKRKALEQKLKQLQSKSKAPPAPRHHLKAVPKRLRDALKK